VAIAATPSLTSHSVADQQMRPIAGIWACPSCGRHIQVMTESNIEQKMPFRCVCGTDMEPGEDHKEIDTNRPPLGH
jgi:hypothetical protein